eukprot:3287555-Amphidinium_carterae.2
MFDVTNLSEFQLDTETFLLCSICCYSDLGAAILTWCNLEIENLKSFTKEWVDVKFDDDVKKNTRVYDRDAYFLVSASCGLSASGKCHGSS